MNEITKAKDLLAEEAAPELLAAIDAHEKAHTGAWLLDPEVPEVVGFVDAENPRRAFVVVYLADRDWECNEERLGL